MTTVEKKSLKAGKYVNKQHVDTVIRNYKQERWVHNSERIGKEDSLSAWWSVEELEGFLAHAKESGADGVKFYFGAYDANYAEKPEYAGRQTLVMVGTKQKVNPAGIVTNKDLYIQNGNNSEIVAYNMGSLCPPFCGTLEDGTGGIGVTIVDKGEGGLMVI